MTARVTKNVLIGVLLSAMAVTLIWTASKEYFTRESLENTPTPVIDRPPSPPPDFTITALQVSADDRRVINCSQNVCQPLPAVNLNIATAVTDGQSWYHYQTVKDEKSGLTRLQLKRTWINEDKSDLLIEQTRLVQPRGLYISPDNQKIAFWLDNISDRSQRLTELWLYDATQGNTRLIAENIIASSVLTEPRWNRASSHLWFLGETIFSRPIKKTALHVVSIQPPSISIQWPNIAWENLIASVEQLPMDLSSTGQSIAYTEPKGNKTILHLHRAGATSDTATISGTIPYLQWLPNGNLLYVVQTKYSFTFWLIKASVHQQVARYQGIFQSARADAAGAYVLFNTQSDHQISQAFGLEIASGRITKQVTLPSFGEQTFIIHFQPSDNSEPSSASITAPIDDEQIAAFLTKNMEFIAQPGAAPHRFITTDKPNTIWLDYATGQGEIKRLLLTIQDANHAEWSISARYLETAGEWVKEQGGVLNTPQPSRLYEWEEGLNQWILKENLNIP